MPTAPMSIAEPITASAAGMILLSVQATCGPGVAAAGAFFTKASEHPVVNTTSVRPTIRVAIDMPHGPPATRPQPERPP